MPNMSGADLILQLREAMLNAVLRQSFDVEQAAREQAAGGAPFWNVQKEDPPFRMRFEESPSLELHGDGTATATLPDNTFETEKTFTILNHSRTIHVTGRCLVRVDTTLGLSPDAAGKVNVVLHQGEITIELTELTLEDEEVTDAQRAAIQTLLQNKLSQSGADMLEGKVASQLDLTQQALDPAWLRIQVGLGRLAIYATVGGGTPAWIQLFSEDSDLIVAIGVALTQPKFQAEIQAKTVGAPPKKLNDHYDMHIHSMNVTQVEGGLKVTGSATAVGHGNHWYEPDWLYRDIDATINNITLTFREIRQPGGYFVFEKTTEEVDVDDCDVFAMVVAGIFTFGMAWGASPGWIFFPVGGWIAGIVELVSMKGDGLSTIEVAPDLPDDIKGVTVQFTSANFGAEGIALFGQMVADLAQSSAGLTSTSQSLLLAGESQPPNADARARVRVELPHMWRGNRRYHGRWRVDGTLVQEGPLAEVAEVEVGPISAAQALAHNNRATVTLDLYERDARGQLHPLRTVEKKMPVVGPFGELQSCYLHNRRGHRVHLALPGAHCYQIALAWRGNLLWGLPTDRGALPWRTCPDCFGRGIDLGQARPLLEARADTWSHHPGAPINWRV